MIIDAERVVFQDRSGAGKRLADELLKYKNDNVIVLAIPRGGVPVAIEVAEKLEARLDVVVPRKIPNDMQ